MCISLNRKFTNFKRQVVSSVRNSACPLVRDKWLFTRTSKQSVSSYPSDKWKFTAIFYCSLSFYYNAVIERQKAKGFHARNPPTIAMLPDVTKITRLRSFRHVSDLLDCRCPHTCALALALYYWWWRRNSLDLCAMGPHLLAIELIKRKVGKPTNEN